MFDVTTLVLCSVLGTLIAYNLWVFALFGPAGTISEVARAALHASPWVPLGVGLLIGHWLR